MSSTKRSGKVMFPTDLKNVMYNVHANGKEKKNVNDKKILISVCIENFSVAYFVTKIGKCIAWKIVPPS